jgi:dipeptidyl aminopeptidase/acylaminoacyl peptidase
MRRISTVVTLVVVAVSWPVSGQPSSQARSGSMLTIDSIMRGPKLVGSPPGNVRWSKDSSKIYFTWQKTSDERSATYVVNRDGTGLKALTTEEARVLDVAPAGRFDRARRRVLTAENGDVVSYDAATGERRQLTRTSATESSPRWIRNDTAITFIRDGNLFSMALEAGTDTPFLQLTDVGSGGGPVATGQRAGGGGGAGERGGGAGANTGRAGGAGANDTESQRFLREQERSLIDFIRRQAEQRQEASGRGGRGGRGGAADSPVSIAPIPRFPLTSRQTMADMQLSADERFVWIGVTERPDGTSRGQETPSYVTESAYPEMIPGRTNVGDVQSRRLLGILDRKENKTVWADASSFAGVERKAKSTDPDTPRLLNWSMPELSDDGLQSVIAVRSLDNKDRWLVKVDPASGKATVLDTLHDDAWVRDGSVTGATAGGGIAWLPDNKRILFLSEKSGYMQLYSLDVTAASPQARALTSGKWEVTDARLSSDRKTMFLTTNEVHPGERQLYRMSLDTGARTRVTTMPGSNEATVSPDEKHLALVYSYSTKPPELYVMPLQPEAKATAVTVSPTDEFRNFKWIDPKVITYKARDGAEVYARLFTPEMIGAKRDPKKPAVVFVHGAGYLQNAHRYWSTYFREYMFHNLLASRGYVVLDPDYRASAGYGRDWRTAIYRHMGGHDLNDVVDGARFLVQTEKVDPKRIGVYGGSYGGFITLMAMFTTPDVFAAGAALRPVTDWAHYNHGYTSNILNVPQLDPEAYKKSSPIYFAEGLKGRLLICHGMVDTNVFFQDSVRLVQRLIELRKENWQVAPYPVENHSFTEETSWADEYKRILKLFEETLRMYKKDPQGP